MNLDLSAYQPAWAVEHEHLIWAGMIVVIALWIMPAVSMMFAWLVLFGWIVDKTMRVGTGKRTP